MSGRPDLISSLTWEICTSLRWKMPAASAALHLVALKTSVKCAGHPAPDDQGLTLDQFSAQRKRFPCHRACVQRLLRG